MIEMWSEVKAKMYLHVCLGQLRVGVHQLAGHQSNLTLCIIDTLLQRLDLLHLQWRSTGREM